MASRISRSCGRKLTQLLTLLLTTLANLGRGLGGVHKRALVADGIYFGGLETDQPPYPG